MSLTNTFYGVLSITKTRKIVHWSYRLQSNCELLEIRLLFKKFHKNVTWWLSKLYCIAFASSVTHLVLFSFSCKRLSELSKEKARRGLLMITCRHNSIKIPLDGVVSPNKTKGCGKPMISTSLMAM